MKISSLNRIIFMGTPEFALNTLEKLVLSRFKPSLVVTQPDKPKGRSGKPVPPTVKNLAISYRIPVFQPENINDEKAISKLEECDPDIIITAAYGGLLKKKILDMPMYGCINLHPSLLPKYRGAAPVNFTLFNCEKITGNSVFQMKLRMDSGPILRQSFMPIEEEDNCSTLTLKLAEQGAEDILNVLKDIENGNINLVPQNEQEATYSRKLTKEDTLIDWGKSAFEIRNKIRGLAFNPGAVTNFRGNRIKIIEALSGEDCKDYSPGEIIGVVNIEPKGLLISTGKDSLLITKVQPAGKRIMTAWEYSLGAKITKGERFNS